MSGKTTDYSKMIGKNDKFNRFGRQNKKYSEDDFGPRESSSSSYTSRSNTIRTPPVRKQKPRPKPLPFPNKKFDWDKAEEKSANTIIQFRPNNVETVKHPCDVKTIKRKR